MAEEQKQSPKDFRAFFEGTPCAEMMRKMVEGKKEGKAFDCAEIMSKMMEKFAKKKGPEETPDQAGKNSSSAKL